MRHPGCPPSGRDGGPLYLAIADAIAADIAAGRLQPGTRLPPQRALAEALGIDFTTVTRAYAEAGKRGLVEGRVGHGTYVRLRQKQAAPAPGRAVDISMNLPPRFEDAALNARMQAGIEEVSREGLDLLLAYQDPGGADWDRTAGAQWLAAPICPVSRRTASPSVPAPRARWWRCSRFWRSGATRSAWKHWPIRASWRWRRIWAFMCSRWRWTRTALLPDSFEAACKAHRPKALYCTPTFHNPTTATIPLARRRAWSKSPADHGVAIIEDDAYGALPRAPVAPLAALAPDCVYHIAGLSKCLSPALRIAYLVLPDARIRARAADAIRAFAGMASPLSAAIVTRWMEEGTAAAILVGHPGGDGGAPGDRGQAFARARSAIRNVSMPG